MSRPSPDRRIKAFMQNDTCPYCKRKMILAEVMNSKTRLTKLSATWDHKIARNSGGKNVLSNMILACYQCNNAKSNLPYDVFMEIMKDYDGEKYNQHYLVKRYINGQKRLTSIKDLKIGDFYFSLYKQHYPFIKLLRKYQVRVIRRSINNKVKLKNVQIDDSYKGKIS